MSILRFIAASLPFIGARGISIATFHGELEGQKRVSTQTLRDICGGFAKGSCIAQGNPDEGGLAFVTLDDTGKDPVMIEYWRKRYPGMRVDVERSQQFKVLNVETQSEDLEPGDPVLPWGLDRIDQRTGLDGEYRPGRELDGEGVHVYVVDTGIRTTHKVFGGRAVPTIDTTEGTVKVCAKDDDSCAVDNMGHGTHVAGTVGGKGVGVAPGVTLHAVKVLEGMTGLTHNLMPAFDWIMRNAKRSPGEPAVIQMSLGWDFLGGKNGSSPALDYAITEASKNAWSEKNPSTLQGILTVVAAGNKRKEACQGFPAHVKAAMTVGASTPRDTMAQYSNYGPCVDIFAPGDRIMSASHKSDDGFILMSGTSMAAPHVSGAAAMVLQRSKEIGLWDAALVAEMLKETSTPTDTLRPPLPLPLLYVGGDPTAPFHRRRRSDGEPRRRSATQPPLVPRRRATSPPATRPPLVPRRRRVAPDTLLEDRVRRLEGIVAQQSGTIRYLVNRLNKCKGCSAPAVPTQRRRNARRRRRTSQ